MSLKVFHILFITMAEFLLVFFSYWAIVNFLQNTQPGFLLAGIASLGLTISLGIYEYIFIKKTRTY